MRQVDMGNFGANEVRKQCSPRDRRYFGAGKVLSTKALVQPMAEIFGRDSTSAILQPVAKTLGK